jgi:glucose/arabinose dehydrogenase
MTAVMATLAVPAAAQTLRAEVVASGLNRPVGFVQDPSDPTAQYILQHDGRIRVLKDGNLLPADFLNLSGAIINSGERGLLGLAFPPDYATSRRFYVSFSAADSGQGAGHTVVARFVRSPVDRFVADPASRFDLRWSAGERFIRQPFELHKSGHLAFGPDGYLYVGTGDGGADANDAGDPQNKAQDLGSLLGKILRIDVSVSDAHPDGLAVPPTNPFVGTPGAAPEIWSLGFRNPWQFSFDAGTGAMLVGDVGHDRVEEIDYEPPARGGRNYGWRFVEGNLPYDQSLPPSVQPLQPPLLELSRDAARSIIGGFIYRGQLLGPGRVGRYFFADFVLRRVYSIALVIDPASGEATAADFIDHTDELGGTSVIGAISAFGMDASGELYAVSFSQGRILRIAAGGPLVSIDSVTLTGSVLDVSGWAIDGRSTTGGGIDAVHLYAYPNLGSGASPIFLGAQGSPLNSRPDVAARYGARFEASGFHIQSDKWIPPGPTLVVAYAHSAITGQFDAVGSFFLSNLVVSELLGWVDQYPSSSVTQPIAISGWAIDRLADDAPAEYGTGVGPVMVAIYALDGTFVQSIPATTGFTRPDIGAIFGARYQRAGFAATIYDLRPGRYFVRLAYWMTAGNRWEVRDQGAFEIVPGPMVAIDTPPPGASVASIFHIGGWAADLRASADTGVDALHVWAYPNPGSGTPPIFLGAASYGAYRPDVGAAFGAQFTNSGYNIVVGPLAPGTYDVVVFAHSTVTGTFPMNRVVRVTVH